MEREPRRLTVAQVREIDRRSIEEFHIPGLVLMENAARAVVEVAWEMLSAAPAPVLILCGPGNNGGDGFAVARHLHNRSCDVQIGLFADPGRYKGDALINYQICQAMRFSITNATPELIDGTPARLVIDAIFGTGLNKRPVEPFANLVAALERKRVPVLAVDIPSGLDADTGVPHGACIRATRTVTFVAEKVGFSHAEARQFLGEITVGDIGCPRDLVAR
jgi:NAD(P)H-hydrate epimerase